MEFFQIAILILFGLAISDLIVGVSNDAVNFLNSSIGSRVAPRHVIMIIASLGMLAGVTFSSGMMEVARKGIFHPQFFTMPELIPCAGTRFGGGDSPSTHRLSCRRLQH
jgi:phosphate/sulfate permease